MIRGKRIEKPEEFVKGEKYFHKDYKKPFKFGHLDEVGDPYFLSEGQGALDLEGYAPFKYLYGHWYEAIEEDKLEDITSETEFERFCSSPLGEYSFDINVCSLNPSEIVEHFQSSGRVDREVTVEQLLADFSDTLSKEQKVAYEDMLGGGFDHVMVDIETLGTEPGCVILSVAAVRFNLETGVISDKFMKVVDIDSCIKLGLGVDGGTLTWWFNQSEEAREHLKGKSNTIKSVLHSLSQFFRSEDQVWGNSARFDLGILADAYKKVGKKLPWDFWNERDVRTLVSFKPEVKNEVVFEGEPHNPIDDCIHQVNYCHLIWRLINK